MDNYDCLLTFENNNGSGDQLKLSVPDISSSSIYGREDDKKEIKGDH